jgi:acid phosphatase
VRPLPPARRFRATAALAALALVAACRGMLVDPAATHELPPFSIPALPAGKASATFFALGDAGTGGPGQRAVAAAMARKAERDGCDFVLLLGDNFYPDGVDSEDDPRFEIDFEQVYAKPALDVPFFAVLGNHDHHPESVVAQLARTKRGTRWCMPGRRYAFERELDDGTLLDFFAVDTTPIHRGEENWEDEVVWLRGALRESKGRWKIVFGHHPVRSAAARGSLDPVQKELEPVLVEGGADLYLCGHHHCLQMLKPRKGLACVVSGAGGGADNPGIVGWTDEVEYAATLGGFVAVRATRDQLLIEFVRMDGGTQYARVIEKEAVER